MDPIHSNIAHSKLTISEKPKSQKDGVLTRVGKSLSNITHLGPFKSIKPFIEKTKKESSKSEAWRSEFTDPAKQLLKTLDCVALIFSFLETQEVKATSIAACGLIPNTLYLYNASESSKSDQMTPTHLSNIPIGNRLIIRRDSLYTLLLGHQLFSYQHPDHTTLPELPLLKKSREIAFSLLLATENPTEALDPNIFVISIIHAGGDKEKIEAIQKIACPPHWIKSTYCYSVAAKIAKGMEVDSDDLVIALRNSIVRGHLELVKAFASNLPSSRLTQIQKKSICESVVWLFENENLEVSEEILNELTSCDYIANPRLLAANGAVCGNHVALFNRLIEEDPILEGFLRTLPECLFLAGRRNLKEFLFRSLPSISQNSRIQSAIRGAATGGHIELVMDLLNHLVQNEKASILTALLHLSASIPSGLYKKVENQLIEKLLKAPRGGSAYEGELHLGAVLVLLNMNKPELAERIFHVFIEFIQAKPSPSIPKKLAVRLVHEFKEFIQIKLNQPIPKMIHFACKELQIPESIIQYWTAEAIIQDLDRRGYADFAKSLKSCLIEKKS